MATIKEFNSNKIKRTFWPFTLKDKMDGEGHVIERGKKIVVRMPQKGVFEAIKQIQAGEEDETDITAIYDIMEAVLNNNMGRIRIDRETIEDYDIEECTAILEAYMDFVDKLKENPN